MECFLPSQIARLVLGYLQQESGIKSANEFLRESPHLKECLMVFERGLKVPTKVEGKTLLEILQEYCHVRALIQEAVQNLSPDDRKKVTSTGQASQLKELFSIPKVHAKAASVTTSGRRAAKLQGCRTRMSQRNVEDAVTDDSPPASFIGTPTTSCNNIYEGSAVESEKRQPEKSKSKGKDCKRATRPKSTQKKISGDGPDAVGSSDDLELPRMDADDGDSAPAVIDEMGSATLGKRLPLKKMPPKPNCPEETRASDEDECDSRESIGVTFLVDTFLHHPDLQEKLAENINKVYGPLELCESPKVASAVEAIDNSNMSSQKDGSRNETSHNASGSKELDHEKVQTIIEQTESDPAFDILLKEILGENVSDELEPSPPEDVAERAPSPAPELPAPKSKPKPVKHKETFSPKKSPQKQPAVCGKGNFKPSAKGKRGKANLRGNGEEKEKQLLFELENQNLEAIRQIVQVCGSIEAVSEAKGGEQVLTAESEEQVQSPLAGQMEILEENEEMKQTEQSGETAEQSCSVKEPKVCAHSKNEVGPSAWGEFSARNLETSQLEVPVMAAPELVQSAKMTTGPELTAKETANADPLSIAATNAGLVGPLDVSGSTTTLFEIGENLAASAEKPIITLPIEILACADSSVVNETVTFTQANVMTVQPVPIASAPSYSYETPSISEQMLIQPYNVVVQQPSQFKYILPKPLQEELQTLPQATPITVLPLPLQENTNVKKRRTRRVLRDRAQKITSKQVLAQLATLQVTEVMSPPVVAANTEQAFNQSCPMNTSTPLLQQVEDDPLEPETSEKILQIHSRTSNVNEELDPLILESEPHDKLQTQSKTREFSAEEKLQSKESVGNSGKHLPKIFSTVMDSTLATFKITEQNNKSMEKVIASDTEVTGEKERESLCITVNDAGREVSQTPQGDVLPKEDFVAALLPPLETPEFSQPVVPKRLSQSTPRQKCSYVRALDFSTPTKENEKAQAMSVGAKVGVPFIRSLGSSVRAGLFKSPPETADSTLKVLLPQVKEGGGVTPKATGEIWDKVGAGMMFESTVESSSSPETQKEEEIPAEKPAQPSTDRISASKKNAAEWDEQLRALVPPEPTCKGKKRKSRPRIRKKVDKKAEFQKKVEALRKKKQEKERIKQKKSGEDNEDLGNDIEREPSPEKNQKVKRRPVVKLKRLKEENVPLKNVSVEETVTPSKDKELVAMAEKVNQLLEANGSSFEATVSEASIPGNIANALDLTTPRKDNFDFLCPLSNMSIPKTPQTPDISMLSLLESPLHFSHVPSASSVILTPQNLGPPPTPGSSISPSNFNQSTNSMPATVSQSTTRKSQTPLDLTTPRKSDDALERELINECERLNPEPTVEQQNNCEDNTVVNGKRCGADTPSESESLYLRYSPEYPSPMAKPVSADDLDESNASVTEPSSVLENLTKTKSKPKSKKKTILSRCTSKKKSLCKKDPSKLGSSKKSTQPKKERQSLQAEPPRNYLTRSKAKSLFASAADVTTVEVEIEQVDLTPQKRSFDQVSSSGDDSPVLRKKRRGSHLPLDVTPPATPVTADTVAVDTTQMSGEAQEGVELEENTEKIVDMESESDRADDTYRLVMADEDGMKWSDEESEIKEAALSVQLTQEDSRAGKRTESDEFVSATGASSLGDKVDARDGNPEEIQGERPEKSVERSDRAEQQSRLLPLKGPSEKQIPLLAVESQSTQKVFDSRDSSAPTKAPQTPLGREEKRRQKKKRPQSILIKIGEDTVCLSTSPFYSLLELNCSVAVIPSPDGDPRLHKKRIERKANFSDTLTARSTSYSPSASSENSAQWNKGDVANNSTSHTPLLNSEKSVQWNKEDVVKKSAPHTPLLNSEKSEQWNKGDVAKRNTPFLVSSEKLAQLSLPKNTCEPAGKPCGNDGRVTASAKKKAAETAAAPRNDDDELMTYAIIGSERQENEDDGDRILRTLISPEQVRPALDVNGKCKDAAAGDDGSRASSSKDFSSGSSGSKREIPCSFVKPLQQDTNRLPVPKRQVANKDLPSLPLKKRKSAEDASSQAKNEQSNNNPEALRQLQEVDLDKFLSMVHGKGMS